MQISMKDESNFSYICKNLSLIHENCLKSRNLKHGVTLAKAGML